MKMQPANTPMISVRANLFSMGLLLALGTFANAAQVADSSDTRPDLTGRVLTKEGVPLTNASVFIFTAGPRVGSSPI